ncbi:class I lanthipeptide [Flavobacterium cerinum]|uniref:Class I lanthipeptide n=1 Tax=Flavobacterium cerinum TaxID=2502784 RepID=A0ABY5IXY0_9FLAO|nr:class I lanthipeptide [Flavobacterium cerinum]UUC46204.1 class I lanthipeptide [Flavobacterium cerinum]
MKKETSNRLAFDKRSITELNDQTMTAIAGGTLTPSSTSLITMTFQTITEKFEN